jgi:hypothetical protein
VQKILLVHYFYRPFSSNQSFRYESIIKSLNSKDIRIDILTSNHIGLPENERTDNGFIYRVNSRFLMKDLEKKKNAKNNGGYRQSFKAKLLNVMKKLMYKVIWPDFAGLWIFPAIIKGRQLAKAEDYDLIISGSFPFSSHLVGYFIKGVNKDTKWVVDYLDPFSIIKHNENPSNNTKIFRGVNRWVEKQVNKKADKIIILKEAYSSYKSFFPELLSKTKVAPPMLGIDIETFYNTNPIVFSNNGINIVFIGSLYKSIRNPEPILKIFEGLSDYKCEVYIHFVGDLKDCSEIVERYKNRNKVNIITHGLVSREKAISFMKGADVLLNISNSSQIQLPGKVVEYTFAKKKIINYSIDENSNTTKFFEEVGLTDRIYNIVGKQCSMNSLYNFLTNSIEEKEIDINKYLPEDIAKIYLE